MRVQAEGLVHAAVERPSSTKFIACSRGSTYRRTADGERSRNSSRDPGLGHLLDEQREDFGSIGDHADVGGIALVPGAAVGEAVERDAG